MKKVLCTAAAVFLCLNTLLTVAAACGESTERIDYEDGSYAVITTERADLTRAAAADSRTYTFYDSLGQRCFAYTLYASFSYDGVNAIALTSSSDIAIYRRGWDVESHSEYTFGNAAYGRASFSGPDGVTRPVYLSLTCDKNGNVS